MTVSALSFKINSFPLKIEHAGESIPRSLLQ